MKAIILAAGVGRRLGVHGDAPKCLLKFGGLTLLERHIGNLQRHRITDLTICVGYRQELIREAIVGLNLKMAHTVFNDAYREGSVVSLWSTREILRSGEDIILMDADVLYVDAIMDVLVSASPDNRFLCDRNFESGDEPVKICQRDGRIVEFRKRLDPDLEYNNCGESVGFFCLTAEMAARLADVTDAYIADDRREEPYEEAIRDLALARPDEFRVADVTGLPWIEIDFPEDIIRANEQILPQINEH